MNVLRKYLVFALLIVVFNCILICVIKWNLHEVLKHFKCDAKACIKICSDDENDSFDDIAKAKEASKLSKDFKLVREFPCCDNETLYEETNPWELLEVISELKEL